MPRPVTFDAVLDALAEGPCQPAELLARLRVDRDDPVGVDAVAALVDEPRLVDLPDGRIADGTRLAEGVVARHRLAGAEVDARRVELTDDVLIPLACTPDAATVRVGGAARAVVAVDGTDRPGSVVAAVVDLPEGWEPDLAAGDEVGLSLVDGELLLERLPADASDGDRSPQEASGPAPSRARGSLGREGSPTDDGSPPGDRGVGAFLAAVAEAREPSHLVAPVAGGRPDPEAWVADLVGTVLGLAADAPGAVRGLEVPMTEAWASAGIRVGGAVLAGPGVTDDQLGVVRVGREVLGGGRFDPASGRLAEGAGLAWLLLLGAAGQDLSDGERDQVVGRLLADAELAQVVVDHIRAGAADDLAGLAGRLRAAAVAVPGAVGGAWAAVEVQLMRGESGAAVAALEEALVAADPEEWFGAWALRGHLQAVAGDLDGAAATFRRMGEPEVGAYLARWRPTVAGVGRNDRCPCGSGRKYKQCCLASPRPLGLEERVDLVWWKLQTWAQRAARRTVPWSPALGPGEDPLGFLAVDAHLVEDGRLDDALAELAPLLPDDEAALVAGWRDRGRSLWQVERSGDEPVLRDLQVDRSVPARSAPDVALVAGEAVLAVVVPIGDGPERVVGPVVRVPEGDRDGCLHLLAGEPSGQEVLDWVVAMGEALDRAAGPVVSAG